MRDPSSNKTDDPNAVYARMLTHSDRLFEALTDLEAIGGLSSLPLRPGSIEKARGSLKAVRQAIDDQLSRSKAPKPSKPRPTPAPPAPAPDVPASSADRTPIRRTQRGSKEQ